MSDTTTTDTTTTDDPWEDSAHFGSSVLALPISSEVLTYAAAGAEKITVIEAQDRIRDIISAGVESKVERKAMRRIAEMIAKGIPEDQLTDRLIESLDYRPYMQAVINDGRMVLYDDAGPFTQQAVQASLDAMNATNAQLAEDVNIQSGTIGAEAQRTINASQEFTADEVGLSPSAAYGQAAAKVSGGEMPVTGMGEAVFGSTGYDDTADRPVWNEDEVIKITTMPSTVFDTAIQYEADFNEAAGTPGVMRGGIILETGAEPPRIPVERDGGRKFPPRQPTATNKKLSYADAIGYLNTLTVDELTEMQSKMAKAGYFDKIGSQYVPGDHDDQATAKAWEQVLLDAWTGKKGVDVVLIDNAKTARENKKKLAMERWGTSDTSRTAIETAALEILGRNLSADEFTRVRDTISSLQMDRADDLVGVDGMGWYNDTRAAQGFDETDVNERIMREFGGELAIQNAQDVRQKLRDTYSYSAPNFQRGED
jgi:hypothetical protein